MASDLRVPLGPVFSAFGVPATVIRPAPDDLPIEATGVWHPLPAMEGPGGLDFQRRGPQRVMAFQRSEVPTLPTGSTVLAPETLDGVARTWRVDGTLGVDDEVHQVWLVLDESGS